MDLLENPSLRRPHTTYELHLPRPLSRPGPANPPPPTLGIILPAGPLSAVWILYQLVYGLLLVLAGPFLLARRRSHYLESLPRRLGIGRRAVPCGARSGRPIWIHAVSVGEVGVAATLAASLGEAPLLVTTVTPTGQARAREVFAESVIVEYLPFDLSAPVNRFLRAYEPRALVLAEGDYWPLVLDRVKRRGLPVVVVNGRVGDRSFARMRRLRRWLGPLLGGIDGFGVQTAEDRRRLLSLGVDDGRITVTGNLKFEAPEPEPVPELERRLRATAGSRAVLVAGSTMAGEEEAVLDAFALAGGGRRALLVLAPRHPERWDDVARLIEARGETLSRRSAETLDPSTSVVLLDTLGELAAIYRLAAASFVGGTLVPTGGHNPLEPARYGVPTAVGPSMENFRAMAEEFDRARAWRRVADGEELGRVWRHWLDRPDEAEVVGAAAAGLVAANQGALGHTVTLLRELVPTVRDAA